MENRRKFYSSNYRGTPGLWSHDTLDKRYEHIRDVLNVHSIIDDEDLKFIIKNAFISRIYISVKAEKKLKGKIPKSLHSLYNQLTKDGVLDLQDGRFGPKLSPYFDICKLGDKGLGISIEHVVPGEVCKKAALTKFSKSDFENIFNNAYVCLVTSEEAKELDKKCKSALPQNPKTGLPYDFTKHPFARYDVTLGGVNIEVHGPWTMKNGRLERKAK